MPTCYSYQRLSKPSDKTGTTDSVSITRQEIDNRQFALEHGWGVPISISDDGFSGSTVKRPGWTRLVTSLKAETGAILVMREVSRAGRKSKIIQDLLALLDNGNLAAIGLTMARTVQNAEDSQLTISINGAVAQEEWRNTSERQKIAKEHARRSGVVTLSGTRAFGQQRIATDGGPAVPDEQVEREREQIEAGVKAVLSGASVSSVCKAWNTTGLPPVSATRWSVQVVRKLLRSGRIAGLMEHKGELLGPATNLTSIISEDDLRAVRAEIDRRAVGAKWSSGRSYRLTGVLVCSRCDRMMSGHTTNSGTTRTYGCIQPGSGCQRTWVNEANADAALIPFALSLITDPHRAPSEDVASLIADLTTLAADRSELENDYRQRKMIPRRTYEEQAAHFAARQATMETKLRALQGQQVLVRSREQFDSLSIGDQAEFLQTVLGKVDVLDPLKKGQFSPERLSPQDKIVRDRWVMWCQDPETRPKPHQRPPGRRSATTGQFATTPA